MSQKRFSWGIWIALAMTLAAVWFAPSQEEEITLVPRVRNAVSPARQVRGDAAPGKPVRILEIRARKAGEDEDSLFLAPGWGVLAPPVLQEEPPPVEETPRAPPLPFRFMGRYEENGQHRVFLQENDKTWIVGVGDMLSGTYRVETIGEHSVGLRYLPLEEEQVLEMDNTP
jgi:hypothetical protein